MSRLRGLNSRLEGDYYIGRKSANFHPDLLVRKPAPEPIELYERFELKYKRDPDSDSIETLSIKSDPDSSAAAVPKPLEYRITGITWHTPKYINTCNMDSFLSAWVRKIRQTHGSYLKFIQTIDRVGNILIAIADHALCAKEQVDAEVVKGYWLMAALHNSNEKQTLRSPPVDCMGNSAYSVYQHLQFHSNIEIVSECKCGVVYHRDHILEVAELDEIRLLGTPNDLNWTPMPKCTTCNYTRELLQLNPEPGNWILPFSYNACRLRGNESPLLEDIPEILNVGGITFKLEFVTYTVRITPKQFHEVSLQKIRLQWYLYDGSRSPKFRRFSGKRLLQRSARLNTLVYFKIN